MNHDQETLLLEMLPLVTYRLYDKTGGKNKIPWTRKTGVPYGHMGDGAFELRFLETPINAQWKLELLLSIPQFLHKT